MITLESITPGLSLTGLEPVSIGSVVGVVPIADGAVQVIYRSPDGALKERLLNRDDEPNISIATTERPWSFDGDGEAFKLTVEAKRIDLAFLFDPMMAVHTSNVEPLPHQITAVYESMLPRQPLRFVQICIQLVKALDYAHKKGIVHRDVKPGNIMMIRDTTTIKVADFGICCIDNSEATQATQVGNVLGTPNYMSPEQVLGEKVDSRSDLFSAGVVLYQLLTGHLPFDGETLISVAYKITKTDPPSIDKERPDIPLSLRRIVDRSLKKQPEKRFQTGEEFATALIERRAAAPPSLSGKRPLTRSPAIPRRRRAFNCPPSRTT